MFAIEHLNACLLGHGIVLVAAGSVYTYAFLLRQFACTWNI